jgi:hypothetical protein
MDIDCTLLRQSSIFHKPFLNLFASEDISSRLLWSILNKHYNYLSNYLLTFCIRQLAPGSLLELHNYAVSFRLPFFLHTLPQSHEWLRKWKRQLLSICLDSTAKLILVVFPLIVKRCKKTNILIERKLPKLLR